ncbi:hypothetical protein SLE2022_276430 [Rubroshorea leprosula]
MGIYEGNFMDFLKSEDEVDELILFQKLGLLVLACGISPFKESIQSFSTVFGVSLDGWSAASTLTSTAATWYKDDEKAKKGT